MDFAKKQLEKYGWSEGKGLGRKEDGISAPLKAQVKLDNLGVGYDVGEEFTNKWWERVYNSAAENIAMKVDDNNDVKLQIKDKNSVEITTKSYSVKNFKKNNSLEYGTFIKVSKLTEQGTENYKTKFEPLKLPTHVELSDEKLFAACGGRTAHKGARHGLTLSGKLSRVEKQEKLLSKQMKRVSLDETSSSKVEKKLKKLKKQKPKEAIVEKYTPIDLDVSSTSTSSTSIKSSMKKKKKNKKLKHVSFNDNVTVQVCNKDLDTSIDSEGSASVKDENDGSDEGIDLENNNINVEDNQKAFEEARLNFSDLSKAERKKLKKKRDFDAKLKSATTVLMKNAKEFQEMLNKKRKYLEEQEGVNSDKHKKECKKRKARKNAEENAISSISRSLEGSCRISESD
ncbi:unnamed protein product [Ceutorhynchus assimilis]|uniref:G patch domain-containing protein 4 n=1 Tax=Ceutorhynchus assimilis TaxID=467358 RepID=A0A9P0DPD2_9CUCU|nr:unnamed protein product [Ceutorhynchus assimilis]